MWSRVSHCNLSFYVFIIFGWHNNNWNSFISYSFIETCYSSSLLFFLIFLLSPIFLWFNSLINFVSFCSSPDPHGPIVPRIWTHGQVKVVKGESLELVCVAQSWPAASYRWYKEDEETGFISVVPVQFNSHIITSSNEIVVINHADVNHQGKWLCSANNSVGEERISIRVYVIEPLQINIEPAKLIVDIGKPATFNCTVRGNPINYPLVWYKNGKLLVNDVYGGLSMNNKIVPEKVISFHHNLLNIKSVSREDAGQLICLFVFCITKMFIFNQVHISALHNQIMKQLKLLPNWSWVIHHLSSLRHSKVESPLNQALHCHWNAQHQHLHCLKYDGNMNCNSIEH